MAAKTLALETFDSDPGWLKGSEGAAWGIMVVADGQALLRFSRMEPTDPDGVSAGWIASWSPTNEAWRVRSGPERTLELRTDILQFNQQDAFAALGVNRGANGYIVGLERNEILLVKYGMSASGFANAFFLWENVALPANAPLTLSAAFTQVGQNLRIHLRIFDRTQQAVLWEEKVLDTPAYDAVLPNRAVRGFLMRPEPIPAPYTGIDMYPYVAIAYANPTTAPTQPVEAILDNVQVVEYEAPVVDSVGAICLSWPEETMEGQIVAQADSLATNAVWSPCPEPIFKANGKMGLAVPATAQQQFFKLVAGIQFSDDFELPKPPYASRGEWVPFFQAEADRNHFLFVVTNGGYQVRGQSAVDGRVPIKPPGPDIVVGDFSASVDIVDWSPTIVDYSIGIGARGVPNNAYIAGINFRPSGYGAGNALLYIWHAVPPEWHSPVFDVAAGTKFRLEFSGVGSALKVRLLNLTNPQTPVQELTGNDSTLREGLVGLYFRALSGHPYNVTVDNFCVTGSKP
jgi:hypothetical protein